MGFVFWLIPLLGKVLSLAIVIDALLSWVPYNENVHKIRGFLQSFTAPITSPVRKLLSPLTGRMMIDFTPMVSILVINVLQSVLLRVLGVLF